MFHQAQYHKSLDLVKAKCLYENLSLPFFLDECATQYEGVGVDGGGGGGGGSSAGGGSGAGGGNAGGGNAGGGNAGGPDGGDTKRKRDSKKRGSKKSGKADTVQGKCKKDSGLEGGSSDAPGGEPAPAGAYVDATVAAAGELHQDVLCSVTLPMSPMLPVTVEGTCVADVLKAAKGCTAAMRQADIDRAHLRVTDNIQDKYDVEIALYVNKELCRFCFAMERVNSAHNYKQFSIAVSEVITITRGLGHSLCLLETGESHILATAANTLTNGMPNIAFVASAMYPPPPMSLMPPPLTHTFVALSTLAAAHGAVSDQLSTGLHVYAATGKLHWGCLCYDVATVSHNIPPLLQLLTLPLEQLFPPLVGPLFLLLLPPVSWVVPTGLTLHCTFVVLVQPCHKFPPLFQAPPLAGSVLHLLMSAPPRQVMHFIPGTKSTTVYLFADVASL